MLEVGHLRSTGDFYLFEDPLDELGDYKVQHTAFDLQRGVTTYERGRVLVVRVSGFLKHDFDLCAVSQVSDLRLGLLLWLHTESL